MQHRSQPLLVTFLHVLLTAAALAAPAEPVQNLLPRFDKIAQQLFGESGVPGMSVGIVADGKVVYLKGFGIRRTGLPDPVGPDTVFQLASCSKPVTSTAVAALVAKGKLAWSDRIQNSLPQFALADPWVSAHLSYADLLSHRSSLPEFSGDMLEDLGFSREEILQRLKQLPAGYDFRAGYAYSNFGFTTAAEAAACAAGTSYEDMMQQELFGPLGMNSTSARFTDFQNAPDHASSHHLAGNKATPTVRMPQAQAPAGGISSTARDMTRWMQLHLDRGKLDGKSFIPEAALAETYQVHARTADNPANFSGSGFYGLGWVVTYDQKGRLRLGHSGAFELGIRSSVTLMPQENYGVVVLTNAYPTALPEALSASFGKLWDGQPADLEQARAIDRQVVAMMNGMLSGAYKPATPSTVHPALPLNTYAGHYDNPYYGNAEVRLDGKALTLHLGTLDMQLQHLDRDVFVAHPPQKDFEDLGLFELQFTLQGSGQIAGFKVQGLEKTAPSWFARREFNR